MGFVCFGAGQRMGYTSNCAWSDWIVFLRFVSAVIVMEKKRLDQELPKTLEGVKHAIKKAKLELLWKQLNRKEKSLSPTERINPWINSISLLVALCIAFVTLKKGHSEYVKYQNEE